MPSPGRTKGVPWTRLASITYKPSATLQEERPAGGTRKWPEVCSRYAYFGVGLVAWGCPLPSRLARAPPSGFLASHQPPSIRAAIDPSHTMVSCRAGAYSPDGRSAPNTRPLVARRRGNAMRLRVHSACAFRTISDVAGAVLYSDSPPASRMVGIGERDARDGGSQRR